jgi:hypothetical protein
LFEKTSVNNFGIIHSQGYLLYVADICCSKKKHTNFVGSFVQPFAKDGY